MSDLLLSAEEKKRFAIYCHWEAASLAAIADQMQKLSLPAGVAAQQKSRAAAWALVAHELATTISESL